MSAALIKQLRNLTGSPIVHCKKALEETSGDLVAAQEWLRVKGISQAHKKLNKSVGAGLVGGILNANGGYLLEVLCETDFVARCDIFKRFTTDTLQSWANSRVSFDQISDINLKTFNQKQEEARLYSISQTQENIIIRRGEYMETTDKTAVGLYLHNSIDELLSESGCMLKLKAEKPLDTHHELIQKLAHSLSMQVVAAKPLFLYKENIPQEYKDKEKMAVEEQLDERIKSKPKNQYDEIVKGKLDKQLDQITLYDQTFMISDEPGEKSVKQVLNEASKIIDSPLMIESYKYFACEAEIHKS